MKNDVSKSWLRYRLALVVALCCVAIALVMSALGYAAGRGSDDQFGPFFGVIGILIFSALIFVNVTLQIQWPDRILFHYFQLSLCMIGLLICFSILYMAFGVIDATASTPRLVKTFPECLYFSAVTFTTLGYGDFWPTDDARVVAAFQGFLGYMFMGIVVASVVFHLQHRTRLVGLLKRSENINLAGTPNVAVHRPVYGHRRGSRRTRRRPRRRV